MVRFESARREYEKQTGTSLSTHPLAVQLEHCESVESLDNVLQRLVQGFTASRGNDGIVTKSLKNVLTRLHGFSVKSLRVLDNSTGLVRLGRKARVSVLRFLIFIL
jgi:hypothetical protein